MTGHPESDDDLFEEDLFVVDGLDEAFEAATPRKPGEAGFEAELQDAADEAELFALDADEPAAGVQDPWRKGRAQQPSAEGGADDVLFAAPISGNEFDTDVSSFKEHAQSAWGGANLSPEQMGLPVDDATGDAGDGDIQEVDIEVDPNDVALVDEELATEPEGTAYAPAGHGSLLHDRDGGSPDEGWEDIDITSIEAGPIETEATDDGAGEPEPLPEEEQYDGSAEYATVGEVEGELVELPRRRRVLRFVAGLAAVLLVAAGGAYWYAPEQFHALRERLPEWMQWPGQSSEPTEVVQVARPRIDPIELPVIAPDPNDPGTGPVATDPKVDPKVDPIERPVVPLDPPLAGGRAAEVGRQLRNLFGEHLPPRGEQRPPPQIDPIVVEADPPQHDPMQPGGDAAAPIAVGEDTMFSKLPDHGPRPPQLPAIAQGLVAGTQAVAQLHNGNFFIGRVKVVEAATVTLRLEKGEVTLAYEDLELLSIVGTTEYERLKMAEKAYIRLSNNNTLSGRLLAGSTDGEVVLEMRSSRVVIPIKAIEEIGKESLSGFRVTDETSDTWVQSQAEQRLNDVRRPAADSDPSMPPPSLPLPPKPQGN